MPGLFRLSGVQLVVPALLRQELFVGAALYDAALLQDDYDVGVHYRREPVSYDEGGAARHQGVHAALDQDLGTGIYAARSLVQYHNRRIRNSAARYRKQLALALRELASRAAYNGIVAVRQLFDEVVDVRELGSGDDFLVRGVRLSVANVVRDGACEQVFAPVCARRRRSSGAPAARRRLFSENS